LDEVYINTNHPSFRDPQRNQWINMTKVAAIQMCSSSTVEENLATAASLIAQAATQGAVLAVLPEMFPLLGQNVTDKVILKESPGSGHIQEFVSHLAIKHHIWIVAGTIPLTCDDPNKARAACLVFNHLGEQVTRYDKINLFDASISKQEIYRESDTTEPGQNIVVIDTPVGRLGLCVCYDLRFPEIFLKLAAQGAEVIVAPSAFTVPTGRAHWELLIRCRAIDTFCYVIGACQGGMHHNGRQTYGHSMIVNPWGEVMAEIDQAGNGVICAAVDLKKLYEIRKKIPLLGHPR
jgi:deaminated glutathione amidase